MRAVVNLDGDAMGDVARLQPPQPLLFVSHERPSMDEAPAGRDSAWYGLMAAGLTRSEARRTGEWAHVSARAHAAWRVRVRGVRHLNCTDAALATPLVTGAERRWMRWGPIDGRRGLQLATALVREFLDHTLRGAPEPALLRDPGRVHPALQLLPRATTSAAQQR